MGLGHQPGGAVAVWPQASLSSRDAISTMTPGPGARPTHVPADADFPGRHRAQEEGRSQQLLLGLRWGIPMSDSGAGGVGPTRPQGISLLSCTVPPPLGTDYGCVTQAGFKLLGAKDPPTPASRETGITGAHHHAWLGVRFLKWVFSLEGSWSRLSWSVHPAAVSAPWTPH